VAPARAADALPVKRHPARLPHPGGALAGHDPRRRCQAPHSCPPNKRWHGDQAEAIGDETMLGLADARAAFGDGTCPWDGGLVGRTRERGLPVRVVNVAQPGGEAILMSAWGRRAHCGDSRAWPDSVRSTSGRAHRCPCPFAEVRWASRLETVIPEGGFLGKVGVKSGAAASPTPRNGRRKTHPCASSTGTGAIPFPLAWSLSAPAEPAPPS
jgi:hypothetical protein